jgi:RHS repeat-associated protein
MLTLWQQEELLSASLLQMVTNDLYGMPVNIYDSFGWRKYFLYDALALGGSPNEIDYLWSGTQASFMRNSLYHDAARRLTSRGNEMFKRSDYFTYDNNGLLKQSRYAGQAGWPYFTASGSLNFTRDTSGLITSISGDKQLGATYDSDLQISSINHILPQPFAEGYTYDDNGNRLTSLTNSFIYDDLNRLTESTTHDYTYDADGNMTQEKNKLTGETKKYYYDSENRMTKYEHQASDISPVDTTATYKYDIFGRRLQKNVNNVITNFFWENDTMTYELNEQYQPIRKYLTGVGIDNYEGHLEYSEITDWSHIFWPDYNQPWYSYMRDQVGTVYKVHSLKTRSIAESRAYDSFGNLVNQTGTTKTPLGFQGKYYDAESGLNYFYHRYYNPVIGRFTTEDPIQFEGGLNFYGYVNNNPIEWTDKFGFSYLCFAQNDNVLRIYSQNGQLMGSFNASNNVVSGNEPFPFGTWSYSWHSPHSNAQPSDRISNTGIYIFNVPRGTTGGMGVHAGRTGMCNTAGRCDWQYPTEGCIRTTEDAMNIISALFGIGDPLTHITVVDDEECCGQNN